MLPFYDVGCLGLSLTLCSLSLSLCEIPIWKLFNANYWFVADFFLLPDIQECSTYGNGSIVIDP